MPRRPLIHPAAVLALALSAASAALGAEPPAVVHRQGVLADGAAYAIDKPDRWNGVLLVWSHGYAARLPQPDDAPRGVKAWALAQGYALAGSAYAQAGWAVEQAVPDQLDTIKAFEAMFGKPRRTIAWGDSMGGLVTLALAEQARQPLSGALAACGSVSGAAGMMNMALDGAFAFKTLLAPTSDIALVDTGDDMANTAKVQAVVAEAQATPQGRARLALASALTQMPGWTDPASADPAADDWTAREAQQAKSFAFSVFLPRADQERRAGGAFSWNTGVDYRAQLDRSGNRPMVTALYKAAGLDLDADLATLAKAPRIAAASSSAAAYMMAHYSPTGRLTTPLLTMHTTGDGATVPANEDALKRAVDAAGAGERLRQIFVHAAGHCAFAPAERIAALRTLEARLDSGRWDVDLADVARRAPAELGQTRFVAYVPPPFLRPCSRGAAGCPGAPAGAVRQSFSESVPRP